MNKLLLSILLAFVGIVNCQAQQGDYRPLVEEGKIWTMRYELVVAQEYGKPVRFEEIKLEGDAVFNGKTYKKMWSREWGESENKPEQWHLRDYIREEGGKIYNSPSIGDNLILDFSAQVGDEVFVNDAEEFVKAGECQTLVVEDVTDETICGIKRKCLKLRYVQHPDFTETWIEGIGSLNYGIWGDRMEWGGSRMSLDKCTQNGVVIYSAEGEAAGINTTVRLPWTSDHCYYDLQGRRISGQPKAGIYIRDGRKVVVR